MSRYFDRQAHAEIKLHYDIETWRITAETKTLRAAVAANAHAKHKLDPVKHPTDYVDMLTHPQRLVELKNRYVPLSVTVDTSVPYLKRLTWLTGFVFPEGCYSVPLYPLDFRYLFLPATFRVSGKTPDHSQLIFAGFCPVFTEDENLKTRDKILSDRTRLTVADAFATVTTGQEFVQASNGSFERDHEYYLKRVVDTSRLPQHPGTRHHELWDRLVDLWFDNYATAEQKALLSTVACMTIPTNTKTVQYRFDVPRESDLLKLEIFCSCAVQSDTDQPHFENVETLRRQLADYAG